MHDAADVVGRWQGDGCDVRVVTLPLPGTPREDLWQRFCQAGELPAAEVPASAAFANESLGASEAEFQRRVNELLPDDFGRWNHTRVSRNVLGNQILARRGGVGRPALTDQLLSLAAERVRGSVDTLADSGVPVVGDLGELLEVPDQTVTAVDDQSVLTVAQDVAPALATRVSDRQLGHQLEAAAQHDDLAALVTLTAAAVVSLAGDLRDRPLAGAGGGVANARTKATGLIDRSRTASRLADKVRARHRRST